MSDGEEKRQRPSGAIQRARLAEQAGQAKRTRPVERPCPQGLKVPILAMDAEAEIVRARQRRRPPPDGFLRGLVLTAASYASTFGGGVLATLVVIQLLGDDPAPQVIPMVAAPPAARDDSVGETTRGSIGFEREVVPGVADTPAPRITASVEGDVEARVARPNIAPPSPPMSAGLPAVGAGPPAPPAPQLSIVAAAAPAPPSFRAPVPPPASLASATAAETPAPPAPPEAVEDRYSVTEGVIRQGEWLAASFRSHRIPMPILTLIDREVGDAFDFTRSQPGHHYSLTRDSAGELVVFRYFLGAGKELRVRRTGQGYAVTLAAGSDTEL